MRTIRHRSAPNRAVEVAIFVVDRFQGAAAIVACTIMSLIVLGIGCDFFCLQLDRHFLYFGGAENATLFIGNGVLMSALGGAIVGWLCFTPRGRGLGRS